MLNNEILMLRRYFLFFIFDECLRNYEDYFFFNVRTCITKLLNNEILMLGRFFVIFIFDERVFIQWKMKSRRYVFLSSVLVGIIWCCVCGSFKFVDWTSCTVSVLFLELFMVYCVWDMNIIPCIPQFKSSKRLYVVG